MIENSHDYLESKTIKELIASALQVRTHSYCPYSGFAVGAALAITTGKTYSSGTHGTKEVADCSVEGAANHAEATGSITIYTVCNIENSAFSPSVCAERVAIFKAISEGCDPASFRAIAIVGGKNDKKTCSSHSQNKCNRSEGTSCATASTEAAFIIIDGSVPDFCPPCGVCRQVMSEFCDPDRFMIILARNTDEYKIFTLRDLMPESFGL